MTDPCKWFREALDEMTDAANKYEERALKAEADYDRLRALLKGGQAMTLDEHIANLKAEIKRLERGLEWRAERDRLRDALDGLLDGLDANYDERCGLTEKQWHKRIAEARAALEGKP